MRRTEDILTRELSKFTAPKSRAPEYFKGNRSKALPGNRPRIVDA